MLGILLIDKPLGITSHDVVGAVRRKFGTRRVGHAGTLDPLGTGLLVVAVGPATRFLQFLPLEPKQYIADVVFGQQTETFDREGAVIAESPVPPDLAERLAHSIPKFLGLIDQVPPMYSAVKLRGKPLYAYARAGEEVERKTRTIHIGAIEVLSVEGPIARLAIECSGGTYIRTLADDLGKAIGCGAHLGALHRTQVGKFRVEQATALDQAGPEDLIPLRNALHPMPMVQLEAAGIDAVREGRQVSVEPGEPSRYVALLDGDGRVFSVASVHAHGLQPECVIPAGAMQDA